MIKLKKSKKFKIITAAYKLKKRKKRRIGLVATTILGFGKLYDENDDSVF